MPHWIGDFMNVRLRSMFVKSSYGEECNNISILKYVWPVLTFLIIIGLIDKYILLSNSKLIHILILITIHAVCFIYVKLDFYFITKRLIEIKMTLAVNSKIYMKNIKLGSIAFILMDIAFFIIIIKNISQEDGYTNILWISVIPLFILAYIRGYYCNSIIMYGDSIYASGTYEIEYRKIKSVDIVKEMPSLQGIIYLIVVVGENKILGFDKLYKDEYLEIKKRIRYI